MTLCLDTSVVIEVFRKRKPQFREHLQRAIDQGEEIRVSSIVLHELMYGARISANPQRELELIDGFVAYAQVVPWSAEDAVSAAGLRAGLAATGFPMAVMDALIAGQAVNNGWRMVTSNVKDFIRVPDLQIIDWSDPTQAREIDRTAWVLARLRRKLEEDK
jgi:tRNA(fMet)-specific endonuclease VapC